MKWRALPPGMALGAALGACTPAKPPDPEALSLSHHGAPAQGASRPNYPPEYVPERRAGSVTVNCLVEADGHTADCRLVSVTGGDAFGTSVLSWLAGGGAVYRPARRNGVPVPARASLTIHFNPER